MNKKEQLRNEDLKYITVKTKHSKECRLGRTSKRFLPNEKNLGLLFLDYCNSRREEYYTDADEVTIILRSAWDRRYVLDKRTVRLDKILELF